MVDQPPSSSPANVGRSAGAGSLLAHRVRRWPNIVRAVCLLCRSTLHSEWQSVHVMHMYGIVGR